MTNDSQSAALDNEQVCTGFSIKLFIPVGILDLMVENFINSDRLKGGSFMFMALIQKLR